MGIEKGWKWLGDDKAYHFQQNTQSIKNAQVLGPVPGAVLLLLAAILMLSTAKLSRYK